MVTGINRNLKSTMTIVCQFNKNKILNIIKYNVNYSRYLTCAIKSNHIIHNGAKNQNNYSGFSSNPSNFITSKRLCSSQNDDSHINKKKSLPTIMSFPEIVWPSILKTLKNFILVNFIIRPYFDRDFNLPEFNAGTKHALQVVSQKISSGDVSGLYGLVAPDTLDVIQNATARMSVAQRNEISVSKDDIYFSFPYQVGIMFDDDEDDSKETNQIQKRFVEITMVYHVLRGLKEMRERGESPPINVGVMPEYRDKMSICNYRFIKEFTKGHESDWTVNIVNHFKPSDYLNE